MKVALFYYSQSGQARRVAENLWKDTQATVMLKEIVPEHNYPFPWSRREFFDAFPETRLGIPPSGIRHIDLTDVEDADLVMVVGQSWFLSPSLPLQSFFGDESIRAYLRGRNVVFVNVCRNMWYNTLCRVREYVEGANAHLVGHIVFQDNAQNLVSAYTIVRWLLHGKKEATAFLPAAGVPEKDILGASRFGKIIEDTWKQDAARTCSLLRAKRVWRTDSLQARLLSNGAIDYRPSVIFLEQKGYRMFGFWARFVRKKGALGDERRQARLTLFYVYLIVALFIVSPFGQLFFWLTYPFRRNKITKTIVK